MTKQFNIKVNGKSYSVEVEEVNNKTTFSAGTGTPTPASTVAGANFQPRVVQGSVSAPMPGVITKVLCKQGDEVKVGQVLLVLEAMKMENEISADKAGIVQEVRVNVGQNVAPGEIMAVIA